MTTIIFTLLIFLEFIYYIVIIDIVLSWLTLLGIRLKFKFLHDILHPIYSFIRKNIPTKFGPFDLTPIIIIFTIIFIKGLLLKISPEAYQQLIQLAGK